MASKKIKNQAQQSGGREMKKSTIFCLAVLMVIAMTCLAAAQTNVDVTTNQGVGVTANPQQQVLIGGSTSVAASPPDYPVPSQNVQLMNSSGYPTVFPGLPYGWNLADLRAFIMRSHVYTRSEVRAMLVKAGGSENLLVNGATPFEEKGQDPNQKILIVLGMPFPYAALDSYQVHGQYTKGLEKKKMATAQQCLFAAALVAMDEYANVLEVVLPGHDAGVGSASVAKGIGLIFGGNQTGPGVGGGLTLGYRKDKGFSGYAGIPFIQCQAYSVGEEGTARIKSPFQKLQDWKMFQLRAALGTGAAPAVSDADAILKAAQALEKAAESMRHNQIENLKKAAAATKK